MTSIGGEGEIERTPSRSLRRDEGGSPEARLTVALAEFAALRAEIVSTRTTQSAFIGVGLAAIGALFTLGTDLEADPRLLLAVPLLALVISLLHLAEFYRIQRLGDYIRGELWPYVQRQTGPADEHPPSWERQNTRPGASRIALVPGAVFDGAPFVLFAAAGFVAVLVQPPRTTSERWTTYFSLAATVLIPLLYAAWLWIRKVPESQSQAHEERRTASS